jgi:hypothetical protein
LLEYTWAEYPMAATKVVMFPRVPEKNFVEENEACFEKLEVLVRDAVTAEVQGRTLIALSMSRLA